MQQLCMSLKIFRTPKNMVLTAIAILYFVLLVYTSSLCDFAILFLFLHASYSLGLLFPMRFNFVTSVLIRIVLGMGIIGFCVYYILLLGVGSNNIYILLLLLPIIFQFKKISETYKKVYEWWESAESKSSSFVIALCMLFCVICGNTIITWSDAIVKYMSVVNYAVANGAWKTNVVESIIFADQYTMFCSLITIGAALGAKRFYIWIATLSMCLTFLLLLQLAKAIYSKTNNLLMTFVFFTTPYFLRLGMDMCMDFVQAVFLMAAMVCIAELKSTSVWEHIYVICLLCSEAIFSKLTAAYIVLVIGCVVVVLLGVYVVRERPNVGCVIKKILGAFFYLIFPLLGVICYGYYYMGSPVLPWMNGLFNSPYAAAGNFVDPFQNNPYGLNLTTLLNMVFHTSQNMEIYDGSLGIFLLFILFVPIAILMYRKKEYIAWIFLTLVMFKLSTLFTYNLRYYIVTIVLLFGLGGITLSILGNSIFKNRYARNILAVLIIIAGAIPNLLVLKNNNVSYISFSGEGVRHNSEMAKLLEEYIPEEAWVYAIGDTARGDWCGTLYSNAWYNQYLQDDMLRKNIKYKELLLQFDYVVWNKWNSISDIELYQIINEVGTGNSILEYFMESEAIIVYKVKNEKSNVITQYNDENPYIIDGNGGYVFDWSEPNSKTYGVAISVTNPSEETVTLGYQIAYYDEAGTLLSIERFFAPLTQGNHLLETSNIASDTDAYRANFYMFPFASTQPLQLNQMKLYVHKDRTYINQLVDDYYDRIPLY